MRDEHSDEYSDAELDEILDSLLMQYGTGGGDDGIVYDEDTDPWPPYVLVPME